MTITPAEHPAPTGERGAVMTVAALFVEKHGVYANLDGVDVWDVTRDARTYAGPWPCIAHPPCDRFGRYWSGGPSAKVKRKLGDDDGCFASALSSVRSWGGVIEHPEASHAFRIYGLGRPRDGSWQVAPDGWSITEVEQGHYGHPARKKTWLYVAGVPTSRLPALKWGPSVGVRLDEGFHSKAERDAARAAGVPPRKRLSKAQNIATPIPFRDLLLGLARLTAPSSEET